VIERMEMRWTKREGERRNEMGKRDMKGKQRTAFKAVRKGREEEKKERMCHSMPFPNVTSDPFFPFFIPHVSQSPK